MLHKIIRSLLTVGGVGLGIGVALLVSGVLDHFAVDLLPGYQDIVLFLLCGIIFAIILFLFSNRIIRLTIAFTRWIEGRLSEVPMTDIVYGSLGLTVGLFIAFLVSDPISRIRVPWLSVIITIAIYLLLGYLGLSMAIKRRDELSGFAFFKKSPKDKNQREDNVSQSKILDTSVIIDGRIFDICKTAFVEGPLIIPSFVLEELRHIADSSDALKRNRGRRGLDILNRIQKELDITVQIYEGDFPDIAEVDSKLLKLGQVLNAKVVTNDYNLNKVAEFQGVPVLNINELANAVKPVVLPGEEMIVQVIKDGKEMGQGVAYLDDGTMIVVDGGKKFVGETIGVLVTSVLQTAAGRMIFAKPKTMDRIVS